MLGHKESVIDNKDKKIKQLKEEIERRQFLEKKVQKYVKGIISQNQKYTEFLEKLKSQSNDSDLKNQIDKFISD